MRKRASIDLGTAIIEPDRPVVAGSFTTITFTYTAGHPVDDSGYAKIAFRSVGDFGTPQFDDPGAPNYCTVHTTGDCRIEPRWDPKGHTRPWSRALFLKVRGGFLNSGEAIVVVFGDTSGGSPGWQMQTFCEDTFEFKALVDPIATYRFKELPASPTLRIVPGEPVRAVCIALSRILVDQEFPTHLKLEDVWGNPTDTPRKRTHPGFSTAGVYTITATDENTNLSARSNPIEVLAEDALLRPYWADLHGQSEETIGSGTIEQYFTFARDYALLDIAAHQGNDFQVTDEFWKRINRVTKAFYQPGAFVTFPGYEWSGNTPLGGDRNVYYLAEGGSIARSCTDLIPGNRSVYEDAPTVTDLFRNLKDQPGPRSFAFAHVGGRYADLSMHDPEIELGVEVHSAWGTFEWLVEDALRRGHRVGICANSDGHKCRPGASYPGAGEFGSFGGLTCVLARRLDRESVFEALRSRHFYATTGNRCLMDVELVTGDGRSAIMGDVIDMGGGDTGMPRLRVRVVGTASIESVQVRNGPQVVQTLRPYGRDDLGGRVKIVWGGAEVRGRDRMVSWEGGLRVRGNAILSAAPVNFWNPNQPLEKVGGQQLTWKSHTTGGVSGVILTLEEPCAGSLEIETRQRRVECQIGSVDLDPQVWACGSLGKRIEIYRLPDREPSREFSSTLPLTGLREGDNAIYVRMTQEDGHMAWTSPVYLCGACRR
jgi:hypothetical protein